jgi:hypothetical protein
MATVNEIIEKYMKNERDFSNVIVKNGNFTSIDLRGAVFRGADLSNCDFSHSDLTGADFSFARLTRCHFVGSILKTTVFDNADMKWAVLRNSFMDRTSFKSANLEWAHLCRNDITQADITNASLSWSCLVDSAISEEQKNRLQDTALTSIGSVSIGSEVKKMSDYSAGGESAAGTNYKTMTTEDMIKGNYILKPAEKKQTKDWC